MKVMKRAKYKSTLKDPGAPGVLKLVLNPNNAHDVCCFRDQCVCMLFLELLIRWSVEFVMVLATAFNLSLITVVLRSGTGASFGDWSV